VHSKTRTRTRNPGLTFLKPENPGLEKCSGFVNPIAKLKTGKAPGVDGVMAEHALYCHKSISLHLLVLFNSIIMHKYVPSEFGVGLVERRISRFFYYG